MDYRNHRTQWFNPKLDEYEAGQTLREVLVPCVPALPGLDVLRPNLVSSRLFYEPSGDPFGNLHSPVLDIDFEARLVPSTTQGHYHLYLDGLVMEWDRYKDLLQTLMNFGVIEEGYYQASLRRRMTCVRPPDVKKPIG